MSRTRILLLLVIVLAVVAFFALDLGRFFDLGFIKAQQSAIEAYRQDHPLLAAGFFFVIYIAVTALSLPGAAIMTLAGGAIFGLAWGTLIISFASSIGATLAFLASRLLFRDLVQRRFGDRLRAINHGMAREGAFYLFALRLVPIFPFFIINLLMGLTPIRTWTFYWVSQVGMLAATLVYVNAGTRLAQIADVGGILSPALLGSFALLAVFPLLAKRGVAWLEARKVYAPWKGRRPEKFDYNLLVIGAGSAGLVSAYIAAAVKAKVALIERDKMGGDCLNTGCVPSKALLRSAKFLAQARRATELGIKAVQVDVSFRDLMNRVQRVIKTVEPHDSVERYTELGVDCVQGEARITSPWTVEITTPDGIRTLSARSLVIAAGARPFVPPIPGLEDVGYLTSDTVWGLQERPQRLVVLGGGPIGCELAQAFARIGSRVTQVEMLPRLMVREDPEVSETVMRRFRDEGIDVRIETKALSCTVEAGEKVLMAEHAGEQVRIPFDAILVAVGRVANTQGYGLEELGIETTEQRTVEVNDYMQTIYPNIYACGDVAGPYQFTHTAAHTAWYAAVNALFGRFRRFRADFSVIPWATFTEPEVARVGLNETDAQAQGIAYEVTTYGLDDLDRAIADEAAHGLVKVLTVPGKDKILGATIVGEHAGDLIIEFILAMRHGIGLNKILGTIHIYPTWAEGNKFVAGNWKRAHAPVRVLSWLARYHKWVRGS
ncbi:MAG: FAD-dependent oxidoreductase [Gammaproteobacteria bacterium]|nr:FAD-dependent oxidoreductase [Gammaproteobacteria bacterium]